MNAVYARNAFALALVLVLALVGATLVAACAPVTPTLRSSHYRLTVPTEWQVVEESEATNAPTVLRVPAGNGKRGDEGLELRLYAWPAFSGGADPVDDAVARLAGPNAEQMRRDGSAAEDACGGSPHEISIFGQRHKTVHLKAASGHQLLVTAGRASGSLVAVVGYVRDQPAGFCKDISAMGAAMAVLRENLRAGEDPDRVPVSRQPVVSLGGQDLTELPPPDSTPPH